MDKSMTFVTRICERTIAGKITWAKTPKPNMYQTTVGAYILRFSVTASHQEEGEDLYKLAIYNQDNEVVDSYDDESLTAQGGAPGIYKVMKAAHEYARRVAMGVDNALDQILDNLEND